MKPKLLYLVSEDWYFVSHRLDLARAARDDGFDVSVATQVNQHGDEIRDAGLVLHPIVMQRSSLNPTTAYAELKRLTALYAHVRPDIAHNVAMKPIVLGSIAARRANAKGVVNTIAGLGYAFAATSRASALLRAPIRQGLKTALMAPHTRTIVQSRDDLQAVRAAGLARVDDLRLIPGSGVDFALFDVGPPPPGAPLVVLPARMIRHKGVVEFVEAARILKREGVDARFALVGAPDPLNPSSLTADDIAGFTRDGVIEAWGHQSDMVAVLKQASIVCQPSYSEGLSKSLIEAVAARRAIVTTDAPGNRDLVTPNRTGWLVPLRDVGALANALRDAITNADRRAAFAEAAYAEHARRLDLKAINAATIAVYHELLSAHAKQA